jgi:hypothetical protein
MDCKTARLLLAVAPRNRNELDEGEADALEVHLSECVECTALARRERVIEEKIGSAMRNLPVPPLLSERIVRKLRRRRQKVLRRWLLASAATAAILIGIPIGAWAWTRAHLSVVDPNEDIENMADLRGAPPEVVQNYIVEKFGIKVPMPSGLNYAWFDFCALEEFHGQPTPCLYFVRGSNLARVRVLRAKSFNLAASLEKPPAGSRGINAVIRPSDEDPQVAYEIIFTGDSLDWLMEQQLLGL